jgi:hypothetical protein
MVGFLENGNFTQFGVKAGQGLTSQPDPTADTVGAALKFVALSWDAPDISPGQTPSSERPSACGGHWPSTLSCSELLRHLPHHELLVLGELDPVCAGDEEKHST